MGTVKGQEGEPDDRGFILDPMRRIIRAVHRDLEELLAREGYPEVRIPHINIFAVLPRGEGMRMSEVAAWLQLSPGAVTQLVTHLESLGLAERLPDPTDGRAVIVRPTPAANRGYEAARDRLAELQRRWEDLVGAERWRTFRDVLGTIAAHEEGPPPSGVVPTPGDGLRTRTRPEPSGRRRRKPR